VTRIALAFAIVAALTTMPAAAQLAEIQGEILRGTCESPGESFAELTAAPVPEGEPTGANNSRTAANSFSVVPVTFASLVSEPSAISIALNGEQIACSDIGGVTNSGGDLAIGLMPTNDADAFGIAYLSPSDADSTQTDISLFVVPPTDGSSVQPASVEITEGTITNEAITDITANADTPIAAAANEGVETEPTSVPTATPRPTQVPTPTPTPSPGSSQSNPAPIGTTVETQGLAVTVNSAYFDYGFANAIPRGGYKVMILGVTIENVSDGNRGYSASRFSGIDAVTGNTYNPVTLDDVGVLLADGHLQPGEYVSGTALIEVQETATNVIIKYDADILGDEDLYWS
jgi:hypothetical protein